MIDVAKKLKNSHPEWTFHLVGKDFHDDYSTDLKNRIKDELLTENVFIYGSRNDVQNIINLSDIAILTSQSEGLPVAILEYGLYKKAVVTTDVGEIPFVINNNENGFITENFGTENFYNSLVKLIENEELRINFGNKLYKTILKNNSEQGVLDKFLDWITK